MATDAPGSLVGTGDSHTSAEALEQVGRRGPVHVGHGLEEKPLTPESLTEEYGRLGGRDAAYGRLRP